MDKNILRIRILLWRARLATALSCSGLFKFRRFAVSSFGLKVTLRWPDPRVQDFNLSVSRYVKKLKVHGNRFVLLWKSPYFLCCWLFDESYEINYVSQVPQFQLWSFDFVSHNVSPQRLWVKTIWCKWLAVFGSAQDEIRECIVCTCSSRSVFTTISLLSFLISESR